MKFKFKELDEPKFSSDVLYDVFHNGLAGDLIEDQEQLIKIAKAIALIESLLEQAEEDGVLELG